MCVFIQGKYQIKFEKGVKNGFGKNMIAPAYIPKQRLIEANKRTNNK